jgi:hypothetical protein
VFRSPLPLAAVVLALAGCGGAAQSDGGGGESSPPGDIPDNQAFVAYAPPAGGFTVKVPEGWSRRMASGAVTFTDKLNAIRVESARAVRPLTRAEATRAELPRLRSSVQGFHPGAVRSVQRHAGRAIQLTYLADAAPDAVTAKARQNAVERYVFFHAGRRVTLTLSGPKGADNVDPWRIVTDSLRWTR